MVELFICRSARADTTHMLQTVSRSKSQKTAMMITPTVSSSHDRRFSYAVLSTRTPSDTIMGVHEWECERPMGKDAGSFRPPNAWNTPRTG